VILWHYKYFRIILITWLASSCDGSCYLIQPAMFRALIRDCTMYCIKILLALISLLQYICRCLCAWGCSVFWIYKKTLLDSTMTFIVWWSTISDSHHILHTGTWLRGDHFCKCWRSSCAPGQETFLTLPIGDKYDATTKNWLVIFNYLYFLVRVDNLLKLG